MGRHERSVRTSRSLRRSRRCWPPGWTGCPPANGGCSDLASVMGQIFYPARGALAAGEGRGHRSRARRARPPAVHPAGTIRPGRDRRDGVPSPADPRRRLRRGPEELRGRSWHERFADVAGRCRRIAREAGRDRRLSPGAGVPLPSRARSGGRTRTPAGRRRRATPRDGGRTGGRAERLRCRDRTSSRGRPRCSLPTTRCGSASSRTSGRSTSRPATGMAAEAIFDEAVERAAAAGDERLRMHAVIMRWLAFGRR